jgi:hypothetical protein
MLVPTRVHFLSSDQERQDLHRYKETASPPDLKMTDICCGTFHSLATDLTNNVWSWGGRGDVCLGQNDSPLAGIWAERCQSVFPTLSTANKLMVPYDLLPWCRGWAVPRLIKSLQFHDQDLPLPLSSSSSVDRVIQLSAGDMHTTVLYESGRLYLCGNGPVVTPIQLKGEEEEDDEEGEGEGTDSKEEVEKAIKKLEEKLVTVSAPRCPSSLWYERLSVRKIKYVSSAGLSIDTANPSYLLSLGIGTYSIVVQDEDMIVSSLTQNLLQQVTGGGGAEGRGDNGTISSAGTSSSLLLGGATGSSGGMGRGKADCLLIAAGRMLMAHRYRHFLTILFSPLLVGSWQIVALFFEKS